MRLFALEYFRQFGNADVLHFSGKGKKAQLKVRNQLGHFLYNKREEGWQEADRMLEALGLETSFLWTPYDPNHFIALRRVRYRLASYNHLRIPHLEQYANQPEWREGTLEEETTQKEKTLAALRDFQKSADLELASQVPPLLGTERGTAASSSTGQQLATRIDTQISSKGKEKQMEPEQEQVQGEEAPAEEEQQQEAGPPLQTEQTTAPSHSEQQAQVETLPRQVSTTEASVLQTPQNEERSKKRDKEEETPYVATTSQGEKRQRLNPLSEEEVPQEQSLAMGPRSRETSAASLQQNPEGMMGGEVSSSGARREGEGGIKQQFIEIKKRNEPLRLQLYNHLLKMAPTNQQRLMSAYDVQEGKMIMSHFAPAIAQPQTAADYLRTNLEVLAKDIHPMDQIELHKQTGEMVYASLADKALTNIRLENSLNNTSAQLELEKASSQAKDNRIKALEDIIIELGHDPKDIKAVQALLKLRDADMAALKKMIKVPATIHPQTEEVAQLRHDKDAASMLITLYKQLIQTQEKLGEAEASQAALQTALQERQGGQTSQPPPQTANLREPHQSIVPPAQQAEQAAPSTSTAATATEQASSLDMQRLKEEILALETNMAELKQVKENLDKINEKYDKSKQSVAEKGREIKALKERIKELEKELSLDKVTAELKKIIWLNIGQSITDQWHYIETMYEQMDLITKAHREIQRARASLGNMPEIANRMISVLNNRTSAQLAAMGIANRTETVLIVKRVLTLRSLVQTLDRRTQDMQAEVNKFMDKFLILHNRGLPGLLNSAGRLLSHENYAKRVSTFATSQIAEKPSTSEDTGPVTGQIMYNRVENLFFIMNEIKHLFDTPPNFYKYSEADETLDAILRHQLPTQEVWTRLIGLIL